MVSPHPSYTSARGLVAAGDLPVDAAALATVAWQLGWPTPLELAVDPGCAARLDRAPTRRCVLVPADDPTWRAMEDAGLARRTGLSRGSSVDRELTALGVEMVRASVREQAERATGRGRRRR